MSKKLSDTVLGSLIGIGLIIAVIIWLYNTFPVLFWIAIAFLVLFFLLGTIGNLFPESQPVTSAGVGKKIGRTPHKPKFSHKTMTLHNPKTGEYILETDWVAQFEEIDRARRAGDYDFARLWLQRFAYTITGNEYVSQEIRDRFKRAMTCFAKEDPLYREVIDAVKLVVEKQPGILQSKTYPLLPHIEQETIRYVLYFAHELGDITRRKKGRSYELLPPGQVEG